LANTYILVCISYQLFIPTFSVLQIDQHPKIKACDPLVTLFSICIDTPLSQVSGLVAIYGPHKNRH